MGLVSSEGDIFGSPWAWPWLHNTVLWVCLTHLDHIQSPAYLRTSVCLASLSPWNSCCLWHPQSSGFAPVSQVLPRLSQVSGQDLSPLQAVLTLLVTTFAQQLMSTAVCPGSMLSCLLQSLTQLHSSNSESTFNICRIDMTSPLTWSGLSQAWTTTKVRSKHFHSIEAAWGSDGQTKEVVCLCLAARHKQ